MLLMGMGLAALEYKLESKQIGKKKALPRERFF
jgi:hypothetical protein